MSVVVKERSYVDFFDSEIEGLFRNAWQLTLRNPGQALFFIQTVRRQRHAARVRQDWKEKGVHVPPVMIVSITNRCNLNCQGCYARALRTAGDGELQPERFRSVLDEARALGISVILLAGGEPLLRPDILDITRDFPDIVFPVFTNGTLVDGSWVERFRKQRNLIAVASIEGAEIETDARRGNGVYRRLKSLAERVRDTGIFWGCSLTVTTQNLAVLTDPGFVRRLTEAGCKVFFYVEYVPARAGTEGLALDPEQKRELLTRLDSFRAEHPALFVGFPGDEEEYGGCLAAGRGFVHVAASGSVEACPFAPFSDTNLKDLSLRDALQSPLLRTIRDNHDRLKETRGGCALWAEREWVRSLLDGGEMDAAGR